jgi:hypothetical protein
MKSKVNKIYLKQVKIIQNVMSIHYQKNYLQKDYTCDYNIMMIFMCGISLLWPIVGGSFYEITLPTTIPKSYHTKFVVKQGSIMGQLLF